MAILLSSLGFISTDKASTSVDESGMKICYALQGQNITLNAVLSVYLENFPLTGVAFNFEYRNNEGVWTDIAELSSTQIRAVNFLYAVAETCTVAPLESTMFRVITKLYDFDTNQIVQNTSYNVALCSVPDLRVNYAYNGEAGSYRYLRLKNLGYV